MKNPPNKLTAVVDNASGDGRWFQSIGYWLLPIGVSVPLERQNTRPTPIDAEPLPDEAGKA